MNTYVLTAKAKRKELKDAHNTYGVHMIKTEITVKQIEGPDKWNRRGCLYRTKDNLEEVRKRFEGRKEPVGHWIEREAEIARRK